MTTPTIPSESFMHRLLSAAATYAKFSSGAMALTLLCMASYALVHQAANGVPEIRDWLLPLSLVVNIFAALSVAVTLYLLKRISRLEKALSQNSTTSPWTGIPQQ